MGALTEETLWKIIKQTCFENGISKKRWKWNSDNRFEIEIGEAYRTPDFYDLKNKKVIELFGRTYHDPDRAIAFGRYVKPGRDEATTRAFYSLSSWSPEVIWSDTPYVEAKKMVENIVLCCPKGLNPQKEIMTVCNSKVG